MSFYVSYKAEYDFWTQNFYFLSFESIIGTKIELLGEVMVLWGQIMPKWAQFMGTVWVMKKAILSQTFIHIFRGPFPY